MEAVGLRNGAAFVANPGSEPRRLPRHALPVATPSFDTQRRCGEHQRQQGVQQQPKRGAGPCSANASAAHGSSANGKQRPVGVDVLEQRQQQGAPAVAAPDGGGDGGELPLVWTKFVAETLLPTKQGKFRLRGYRHTVDGGRTYTEPSVIISGSPEGGANVPLRVHDACFTSEVLGSLKCDCREQLELAMDYIRDAPPGMVIYLQQEGRGIGLANKIAAYALQEKGLDTVDANRALGLPDDCREYSAVKHILADLSVSSVRLMTNNPRKMTELAGLGIPVTGRIPCQVPAQKYNAGYLSSKHRRMSHMLNPEMYESSDEQQEPLEGQYCFWDHEGEPSSAGIPLEAPVPLPDGLEAVCT
ncbi:GTP cyclohydrolase II [Micractinium conductrix]|uniref:GTP cyclohydrolase II n=1 Tax=Micractinium conductrix TaxID=554055 RepID=A0A2P6VMP2_9CHLO|nr:GTP cyclohydrolase II [Micractinium conductrix]|eukprot:PSC75354.1 GTP cyclohydrolase II [Micractinium conductrix]